MKLYLRQLWHTEHAQIAAEMVGYPGSFVREVVLYAVTQMVERGERTLDYIALEKSLRDLQAQIENRDELVKANQNGQAVH